MTLGRLIIDADVLHGDKLQMVGWCQKTEVKYNSGKYEVCMERLPWALEQESGGDKGSCSPFKGLFESIKQELEAGCILTTSMQVCAALSSLPHRRVLAELP